MGYLKSLLQYLRTEKGAQDTLEYFRAMIFFFLTVAGAIALYRFFFE